MASSVKLDDVLKGRIEQLAKQRDRSPHWVMREAIRQYVEREEARESFREEALASWTAYRETGQHLSGAEAIAWVQRWGSPDDGSPACHD